MTKRRLLEAAVAGAIAASVAASPATGATAVKYDDLDTVNAGRAPNRETIDPPAGPRRSDPLYPAQSAPNGAVNSLGYSGGIDASTSYIFPRLFLGAGAGPR